MGKAISREEETPRTLDLMRSHRDLSESFLITNHISEMLLKQHIAILLGDVPLESSQAEEVQARIKGYFGKTPKHIVEQNFRRIKEWLKNPISPEQIHGFVRLL